MAHRIAPAPSLSPSRRFIVSPQLPFRTPGAEGSLTGFRTANSGPPPPLNPPQGLQRHTRSTNDLSRKPIGFARAPPPTQTRGRTFNETPQTQAQRNPTPIGFKARGLSPAVMASSYLASSPKLMARDIRARDIRARSPEMEPRLMPARLAPSSLRAPAGNLETGPSPRQFRRTNSQQPPLPNAPQPAQPAQASRKSHPGTATGAPPPKTGEAAYENQMSVLRSSLLSHIATVQKEIHRLQTERKKNQDNFQQRQADGNSQPDNRIMGTPSTLSLSSTAREREIPAATPGSAAGNASRDDIRSSGSDCRADPRVLGDTIRAGQISRADGRLALSRALSLDGSNRGGSARGYRNGMIPQPPQIASARQDSRNGAYDAHRNSFPITGSVKSRVACLEQSQGNGAPNSSRLQTRGRPEAPHSSRRVFRPVQTYAARIQRAWKLWKWRRNFKKYGEKLGWVGTLDWLQKHNQLYGTELAEPVDVRTWEIARADAPLDAEVDPWGAEKLQDHLHRMWFGEPAPQTHRRCHSEARQMHNSHTASRREQSVGVLGVGLNLPAWRQSPSIGQRQLPDVQLSQVSPNLPGRFVGLSRSPDCRPRTERVPDRNGNYFDLPNRLLKDASQSARLLNNNRFNGTQHRNPLWGTAYPLQHGA